MAVRFFHATARRPGAIAIIQMIGETVPILRALTGRDQWPLNRMRLVKFGDIDEGLAVQFTENIAQLMPHGGQRVVQRLTQRLVELGAVLIGDPSDATVDPQRLYPEAADRYEAIMLDALSRAQSPLAIDLLLDQPRRWREIGAQGGTLSAEDVSRSDRLDRLLHPPVVVLAGEPNVGKSTLSNALMGRSMSIANDMPGTTRDYTAGWIDLAGVVVSWHDTPGMHETSDAIERRAIDMAAKLVLEADLLVAMTDVDHDWPKLPRSPDVCVINKIDLGGDAACADRTCDWANSDVPMLRISATTGEGIPGLVASIRERLVPDADLQHSGPWLFDERLIKQTESPPISAGSRSVVG